MYRYRSNGGCCSGCLFPFLLIFLMLRLLFAAKKRKHDKDIIDID